MSDFDRPLRPGLGKPLIEVLSDWLCECGTPVFGERCPTCNNDRNFKKPLPKCSRCGGDAIPGDPGAYFDEEDDNVQYCSRCVNEVANE